MKNSWLEQGMPFTLVGHDDITELCGDVQEHSILLSDSMILSTHLILFGISTLLTWLPIRIL